MTLLLVGPHVCGEQSAPAVDTATGLPSFQHSNYLSAEDEGLSKISK